MGSGSVIQDLRTTRDLRTAADAVLVVGSGAAGLALAQRVSESGRSVVVLESGGDLTARPDPGTDTADLNEGLNLGLAYTGLRDGRSRNLGGTTHLWHGQCMRLHPIDVRRRPWVPHSGWPIALTDLDEHYAAAERWLGVSGRGYGAERWQEHPELAPIAWDSTRLLHDFTEYAPKPMLGRVHRPALVQNPLVQVILNATVGAVLTEDGRTTGVVVYGPDRRRVEIRAANVVLAAGAIENARLLQLSDPAAIGLGDGRQHTGRFLQDHPIIRTAEVIADDFRPLQDRYVALHRGKRRLFPKVRLAPEVQQERGLLDATAVFVHDHSEPGPAAARRVLTAARARRMTERPVADVLTALRAPVPVLRDGYRRFVFGRSTAARPSAVWLQVWLEQTPDPDSRISLSAQKDSLGMARAQVDWRVGDREIETSREMTRWIAADLQRLGLARVRELPAMHDEGAWRAGVTDAFHPSGTTRMSHSPDTGVVDPALQVHGVHGLHVVGGSVFPTGGYANPTLTIVALALRLADRLTVTAPPGRDPGATVRPGGDGLSR